MSVRERFEQDLIEVQQDLMRLCELSINALENAFAAFVKQDVDGALAVIENDVHINHLEEQISDRVILLIAKQQPVATDLRRLMAVVKAAADLERVGDYAVNIAKDSIRIGRDPFITSIEPIEQMQQLTVAMLRQIGEAFIEENTEKARKIAEIDDEIDHLHGTTLSSYMRLTSVKSESIAQITYLSFICRHIERCADHATNIAEHLFYLVKGKHYELNN